MARVGWLKRQVRYAKYSLQGYSTSSPEASVWDKEWRDGDYDRLDALHELGHYSLIVGYCWSFRSKSILDIGCGHGSLAAMLGGVGYEHYVGVDFAASAIATAKTRTGLPNCEFFAADGERFEPTRRYDTLIFNESLYLFNEPDRLLRRYRSQLEPGGRVIVSAFVCGQERSLFKLLETEMPLYDKVEVRNVKRQAWEVAVFADPKGAR
jgi:SAM-dependent methyltransferase